MVAQPPRLTPLLLLCRTADPLGGIRPLIEPVADALGLQYDCIYSNVLKVAPSATLSAYCLLQRALALVARETRRL